MVRVAGTDPGTSSLDVLIMEDGNVADQCRIAPETLRHSPAEPVQWLKERGPFDLIAGPSGYGLPLKKPQNVTQEDLFLMSLVRPDEAGSNQGVLGFRSVVREFCQSSLPVVFLPGVVHLPTVPSHRKINRVDMGTPDKLCVAALAITQSADIASATFCLVELGSAFTACIVVDKGRIVDGAGGTSGPVGWQSGGGWDGEAAYLLSPLAKNDLFSGGASSCPNRQQGIDHFCESLVKTVAGLQAVTRFDDILLSGRLLETETNIVAAVGKNLSLFGNNRRVESLHGAWVKHAAQGAAIIADGLAGGKNKSVVARLQLKQSQGTVFDWLQYPRGRDSV